MTTFFYIFILSLYRAQLTTTINTSTISSLYWLFNSRSDCNHEHKMRGLLHSPQTYNYSYHCILLRKYAFKNWGKRPKTSWNGHLINQKNSSHKMHNLYLFPLYLNFITMIKGEPFLQYTHSGIPLFYTSHEAACHLAIQEPDALPFINIADIQADYSN